MPETDKDLIAEIRDNAVYGSDFWSPIRAKGDECVEYLTDNPWTERDRRTRKNRPMITTDELNQYTNALINNARQHPRAIKLSPAGDGANDQSARFQSDLIRGIEYRSHALTVYMTMLENAVNRGFGFLRVLPEYTSVRNAAEQELRILECPNPNLVTIDPDAQHPTSRDMQWALLQEKWTTDKIAREFPKAQKISSKTNLSWAGSGLWVRPDRKHAMVGEYWRIKTEPRKLLRIQPPLPSTAPAGSPLSPTIDVFEKERTSAQRGNIVLSRVVDYPVVEQIWTNGVEILEREEDSPAWLGRYIPIVSCYGKIMFKPEQESTQRLLMSLVALALAPYKGLCYVRSTQTEVASMFPKTPVVGYVGQFRGRETDWGRVPFDPLAFIEAQPFTADYPAGQGNPPLPLPQRINSAMAEQIQALEILAEGFRRAIQAAIGTSPQTTPQQRQNEKSGIALEQMDEANQVGSYHFIDHFEESIAQTGVILADAIPHYYDTARSMALPQRDGTTRQVRINDPTWVDPRTQQPSHLQVTDAEHDVTISTGPSFDSEREAAESLTDTLLANTALPQIVGPQAMAKIWALALKLRDGGPIVEQISDILSPPMSDDGQPMDPQAKIQQLTQALQQAQGAAQKAITDLQTKQPELDVKLKIAQMEDATKQKLAGLSDQTATTVAAIKADSSETIALLQEQNKRIGDAIAALHESREAAKERLHDGITQKADHMQEAALHAAELAHQSAAHQVPAAQAPAQAVDTAAPSGDTTEQP